MKTLSYEEFITRMRGGCSIEPDAGIGYVSIKDDKGREAFYSEWEYGAVECDASGAPLETERSKIERVDSEMLKAAYREYIKISV